MASNDKATLIGRIAGAAGKGSGANTGLGTADVVIPPLPRIPQRLTVDTAAQFNAEMERWKASLQAQFPIPIPAQEVSSSDLTALQAQITQLLETATGIQKTIADMQAQLDSVSQEASSTECHCTKSDIGLGNVDNTSDADKPISDLTQAALDAKASSVHTHIVANVTDAGSMAYQNSDNVNITGGVINGFYDLHSAAVFETVKNQTAFTIQKGVPVYIVGRTGTHIDIAPADASDPSKMPAIGVTQDSIAAGASGYIHVIGTVTGVNTNGYTLGQTVFVAAGGGFTATKPAYPNLIQNMGRVTKVASNGEILVLGPGRTNDVPALSNLSVFIGNGSGVTVQRQLVRSDISDIGTGTDSDNSWAYRIGSVSARIGGYDAHGQVATVSANSSYDSYPDASQIFCRAHATDASSGSDAYLESSSTHVTACSIRFAADVRLPSLSAVRCFLMMSDTSAVTHLAADQYASANCIGFRFSTAAGDVNWKVVCSNGTSSAVTDTGVAADTFPHLFEIRSNGTSSTFSAYIDGVQVASGITSNVPQTTAMLSMRIGIRTLDNASKSFRLAYFRIADRKP